MELAKSLRVSFLDYYVCTHNVSQMTQMVYSQVYFLSFLFFLSLFTQQQI